MLALKQAPNTRERDEDVPLIEFCDERRLSLRSRVAVLEQVCGTIAEAHAMSFAFQAFDAQSITVDYVDGQLAICVGETVPVPRLVRSEATLRALPVADLLIASNLIFLGRVVRDVLGEQARNDEFLALVCGRATALNPADRFENAAQLRDRLREWLSPPGHDTYPMSWTWA